MIEKTLGPEIDIHGGGHDLIFPHHENEIAQSRCAHDQKRLARYWMHNGFLAMEGEKMSKSEGNVKLVHELIKDAPGEALRWALLSGHYRAPLDWTESLVEQSRKSLDRLYGALQDAEREAERAGKSLDDLVDPNLVDAHLANLKFWEFLEDDLNTPRAMSALFALSNGIRGALMSGDVYWEDVASQRAAMKLAGGVLGFLQAAPSVWFQGGAGDELAAKVEALLAERAQARKAKDWATADRIRDALDALGVIVMDGPDGATWRLRDSEPK
jgi:cysteinyl-tRNA synthetase